MMIPSATLHIPALTHMDFAGSFFTVLSRLDISVLLSIGLVACCGFLRGL